MTRPPELIPVEMAPPAIAAPPPPRELAGRARGHGHAVREMAPPGRGGTARSTSARFDCPGCAGRTRRRELVLLRERRQGRGRGGHHPAVTRLFIEHRWPNWPCVDYELGKAGRLTQPMLQPEGDATTGR